MSDEKILPSELAQKQAHLSQLLNQREALVPKIGTGEVQLGSSWETTLKVGRVRRDVNKSVERLRGEHARVTGELEGYGRARSYLSLVDLRGQQIAQMNEMAEEGVLPDDVVDKYRQEYQNLLSEQDTNNYLRRGIELVRQEESQVKPQEAQPEEDFILPNGKSLFGKKADLMYILSYAEGRAYNTDELAAMLYPGVDAKKAIGRLSVVLSELRSVLRGSGLELETVSDTKSRTRGQKGRYILKQEIS